VVTPVDYRRIADAMLMQFERVMQALGLAAGKRQGPEYIVRNPTRADERLGSFSISTVTGAWSDFATSDAGGDLVSLARYIRGGSMSDAAAWGAALVGIDAPAVARETPAAPAITSRGNKPAKPQASEWIAPVPDDAPPRPTAHPKHGSPAMQWEYRDADGRLLFSHCRFEPPDQRKQFAPLTLWRDGGHLAWRWKAAPDPRPLLGLPELAARPTAPVLLVEGEKARDAAAMLAPDHVVITWAGGAQAVTKNDWAPLRGRTCLLWPDNDDPGMVAMRKLAALLHAAGAAAVSTLDLFALARTPTGAGEDARLSPSTMLDDGDDAADLVARGWSADHFRRIVDDAAAWQAVPPPDAQASTSAPTSTRQPHSDALPARRFELRDGGLYFIEPDRAPRWIAAPLDIPARTRTPDGLGWGKLCVFRDPDGREHRVIIGDSALRGDGLEALGMLLDHGLQVAPSGKKLLIEYLHTADPDGRIRTASRTGWQSGADDARVFVLPDAAYGLGGDAWLYQSIDPGASPYQVSGTVDEWREHVSALCRGNSRLVLSVACSFAAPLLHLVGAESGGFHWRGDSSEGKTTLLNAALSVIGTPNSLPRWRGTLNGLEGLAAMHCDGLLPLDEIAMIEPREAAGAAYTLASGQMKTRAGRDGSVRARVQWRVLLLSTGEISLAQHVESIGQKSRAGQEVRLLELRADAGQGHGCFEELHGTAGGAELKYRLDSAALRYHGTALPAYLSRLVTIDPADITEQVHAVRKRFEVEHVMPGASGQVMRAAARFALVAAGGELATLWGITGWEPGEAVSAAGRCFGEWIAARGGQAPAEDRQMLSQVRHFIEAHGDGRFTAWERAADDHAPKTLHRAGWRRVTTESEIGPADERRIEYYVLPEVWRSEIAKGFDPSRVARLMVDRGWMQASGEHRRPLPDRKVSIPGAGRMRVLVIAPEFMERGGDD
jgi:uncharacterized protein (DUF927 family)